jgi:hypothetical protein
VAAHTRPNADDVRNVVEERLAAAEAAPGLKETVTVEWRGSPLVLPVVTMPVDLLAYNPDTHRIRAQRTLDSERDAELTSDPWSEEAQAYLHHLLMGDPSDPSKTDPAFDALKDDLSQHGQRDPGIIDRSGLLVNGNTRRAALKELGQPNMRVGVLPQDAGLEDVQAVELSLQLRKEHRRDYSFMNSLLAIDERVAAGWPVDKIQKEFRIRRETFERSRWILETVREILERSRIAGENGEVASLRLVDFETHQGKLEELYRTYTALKKTSTDDAEALREQRILAIALEKSKTDVRLIDADFSEQRKIQELLPEVESSATEQAKVPGLTVTAPAPSKRVEQLKQLTTEVLRAKAISQAPKTEVAPGKHFAATEQLRRVDEALEEALEQAGKAGRLKKKRYAPVDRLSDANEDLQLTIEAMAEARATGNFEPGDLDDGLVTLRANLIKIAQAISRANADGGEGIDWVKELVAPSTTSS